MSDSVILNINVFFNFLIWQKCTVIKDISVQLDFQL